MSELLGERIGNTVLLVLGGEVLAIVLGVSLGLLSAWKNRTTLDTGAITFSLAAWSLPDVLARDPAADHREHLPRIADGGQSRRLA